MVHKSIRRTLGFQFRYLSISRYIFVLSSSYCNTVKYMLKYSVSILRLYASVGKRRHRVTAAEDERGAGGEFMVCQRGGGFQQGLRAGFSSTATSGDTAVQAAAVTDPAAMRTNIAMSVPAVPSLPPPPPPLRAQSPAAPASVSFSSASGISPSASPVGSLSMVIKRRERRGKQLKEDTNLLPGTEITTTTALVTTPAATDDAGPVPTLSTATLSEQTPTLTPPHPVNLQRRVVKPPGRARALPKKSHCSNSSKCS